MAEADGEIILKVPDTLAARFMDEANEEILEISTLQALFDYSDISLEELDDNNDLDERWLDFIDMFEDMEFYMEQPPRYDGSNHLHILCSAADEWIDLWQLIVGQAKNIEVYGYLHHEHGVHYLLALTADGNRVWSTLDYEDGEEESHIQTKTQQWLSLIPARIREQYPFFNQGPDELL